MYVKSCILYYRVYNFCKTYNMILSKFNERFQAMKQIFSDLGINELLFLYTI